MRFSVASVLALWRRHIRNVLIPLLTGLVIIGVLGILSLRWFRHQELAGIMRYELDMAGDGFDRFFTPIVSGFDLLTELGERGLLSLDNESHLNDILGSVLTSQMPYVDQVVIACSDGRIQCYPKPDQEDDIEDTDGLTNLEQLVWYRGAMDPGLAGQVHWTEPYTLSTLGVPGITGSRRYQVEGSEQAECVVALKISLDELATAVQKIGIDRRSKILMISDAGVRDFNELIDANGISAPLDSQLIELATSSQAENEPLRRRMKTGIWWVAARPSSDTKTHMRIAMVVPDRFLREQASTTFYVLKGGYVLVLGTMIIAAALIAWQSGRTLRSLAEKQRHSGDSAEQIKALIRSGENEALEFKSTLRWNLKADRADKSIEIASLKTIVAFMNTEGGTLLVGVTDEGDVSGVEADNFANEDKFLLHFNSLIKQHIGLEFADLISFGLKRINGSSVLVVDCGRSADPVFLRQGSEEEFYIRVGPGSRKLPTSKVLDYVRAR